MLQRSAEWHLARIGKVTASRIHDVMANSTKGEAVTRRNYRHEKILERLFGHPQENDYVSPAMQRGMELEDRARSTYAWDNAVNVEQCGLVLHPTIAHAAASPDGLIGEDGLIEIKCPESFAYYQAWRTKKCTERKYQLQIQWQLACTGRKWCDWIAYREGCPTVVVRVNRDDAMIAEITREVQRFLTEVADEVSAARPG